MFKSSWDSLTVHLFSWLIALTLLILAVGAGLIKYGDISQALHVLR